MLVTSREIQGSASRSPGVGGTVAVLPVATTTARRARIVRVAPSADATSTVRGPASRAWPRTTSMPLSAAHFTCEPSSWLPTK
jgi:hypothetical protein